MTAAQWPRRLAIVGVGTIGRVHCAVLEDFTEIEVVSAVDPVRQEALTFRGHDVPVYPSLGEAANGLKPDMVLIATPTATHAAISQQVLRALEPACILVEKPAAATLAEARTLLNFGRDYDRKVEIVYHFAFAPEVLWGRGIGAAHASSWGPVVTIDSWFTDPYSQDLRRARESFGNSWWDSGINALSVAQWFTQVGACRALIRVGPRESEAYWARIECESAGQPVSLTVVTSWSVTAGTKRTQVTYANGATVVMDHTAVSGIAVSEGRLIDFYDEPPVSSRRISHYRSFYSNWLRPGGDRVHWDVSVRMHAALLGRRPRRG